MSKYTIINPCELDRLHKMGYSFDKLSDVCIDEYDAWMEATIEKEAKEAEARKNEELGKERKALMEAMVNYAKKINPDISDMQFVSDKLKELEDGIKVVASISNKITRGDAGLDALARLAQSFR